MLLYLTSRIISSITAFIYPGYASFKTLSQRPASEEDLERWLMYWSVLGCIVGVEYVAEWTVSWIPFYHTLKTLFLLYLALPQTAGSTYIYRVHLAPFLSAHEANIDAAMASLRSRAYAFLQEKARTLWEAVAAGMQNQPPVSGAGTEAGGASAPPPSLQDPVSGPAQMLGSLWSTYGPAIVASGAALLRQAPAPAASSAAARADEQAFHSPPSGPSRVVSSSSQSAVERRRQLEAELAALSTGEVEGYDVGSPALSTGRARTSSSESDLRERSGRGFEEVEVPSDAEGSQGQPSAGGARRSSGWFGWGGAQKDGYERVKND
ncbi:hypothetical protein DENSPDRAFT_838163 [Dentipellis sp. KUC8613]|nr:hypothetical protein DENSPDRAFT_838163 [Dentipellis sp. KUC8613]